MNEPVRPRGSASGKPVLKTMPKCARCGTSVDGNEKYCATCKEIVTTRNPQAQTTTIRDGQTPKPEGL